MGSLESYDLKLNTKPTSRIDSNLRKINISKCSICLQDMNNNQFWIPCAHSYHEECIHEWEKKCKANKKPNTCPLCNHIYAYS